MAGKRKTDKASTSTESPNQNIPPGTYLVQLPKEQIYRVPSPENARRYEQLSKAKPRRRGCLCCFLASFLVLIVLAALFAGIFFLIYRPEKPHFSVVGFSVAGFKTSSAPFTPVIEAKVQSENGSGKIGLIYGDGTVVEVFYDGIKLGNGEFTAFEQPEGNVTVITTELTGSRIQLTTSSQKKLTKLEKKGKVPFDLRIKAPVKFEVGAVKTWPMVVKVDCKITVDKVTTKATVVTENCDSRLGLSMSFF